MLMLSSLQHFAFCRRQWALIHVEQQWAENVHTAEGDIFHRRAHDAQQTESRGDTLIVRGLRIQSQTLGLSGVCDVVEFHRAQQGVTLAGRDGRWRVYPVEYKKGAPKENDADELQLCAQALCLEEMLLCEIPEGSLYYGETRRREVVPLEEGLRAEVRAILAQMNHYARSGLTPKARRTKSCNACSLRDLCLPQLEKLSDVSAYIRARLEEDG